MTVRQDTTQLRIPVPLPGINSTHALALLAIALAPLLMLAWQLKPIYYDNQNTKFLHALANSGVGFLREDWLAQTKDGLPLFTGLLEAIFNSFGPNGFYLASWVSFAVFLFCSLIIYRRISAKHDVPAHGLIAFLAIIFVLAALTDVEQLVFQGFAEQYILVGYFQTADFGVLLLCAVLLFEKRLFLAAILCVVAAASVHPAYVVPGAVLVLAFLLYDLLYPAPADARGRRFLTLGLAVLGLAALLAIALGLKLLFSATDPQSHQEAQRILTEIRIPHHADPRHWFNHNVIIQFALCLLAARLLPQGRFRFVMRFGVVALAVFCLLAFLPNMEAYRFVAPWRLSVVIVPLASLALCALAVVRLAEAGAFDPARLRRTTATNLGVILLCTAGGAAFTANKFLRPEPAYLGFVRANLASGQHYLTAPGRAEFRLATGAPQYVTFKSHPYQDVEVLEWHRRLKEARALFQGAQMDCERLRRLATQDTITHVLETGQDPDIACAFATKLFEAGDTEIFRLESNLLRGAQAAP